MTRLIRITSSSRFFLIASTAITCIAPFACASLKLGSTFSDNMVVQRDRDVIVWGEADTGGTVRVQLGDETATTQADASGNWNVLLKPLPVGGPYTASITSGSESIQLKNILSGDVWLCAGQSNMQMGVNEDAEAAQMEADARAAPTLRLLSIPKSGTDKPIYLVDAHWTTADSPALEHFSAVAVHFGLALSGDPKLRGVPIGLIDSSFGGTAAEGWTPVSTLGNISKEQQSPSMFNLPPGSLYNSMIAPLGPLSPSGIVWYQGESNAGKPEVYPAIMHQLIVEWRRQFHRADLPFIVVQLPPFVDSFAGLPFTWLRDAQSQIVQENPNTGLVVSIDTTNGFNLHPREKGEIGRRAALQARRLAYHEDITADGPTVKNVTREVNTMWVTFDTHGGPLVLHGEPGQAFGFSLAGPDHIFHFAGATLEGPDTVVVHCPDVPYPVFVRYAWAAIPVCNLYNSAGLPAAPFRTDQFPPIAQIEIKPVVPSRRVTTDLYDVVITGNGDLVSLGVDKQQFISNDLDNGGVANFPRFFGPRQLQTVVQKTYDSISFSDVGLRETYAFSETAMTLQIENLSKDAKNKVGFRLRVARGVHIVGDGKTFDLVRGHSHVRITGADSAKEDLNGGENIELNIDGNTGRTMVLTFSKS